MTDIDPLRRTLVARILERVATAPRALRRAAFDNHGLSERVALLVEKVAHHAYKVTDEDVAAVRAAGLSEDQIFEIVVYAAVGQSMRQYDAGRAALDAAEGA